MNEWLGNAVARAENISDWLSPQRQASIALLRESEWPTRKTEAWKYTPVHVLADSTFTEVVSNETVDVGVTGASIDGLNSIDLLFFDGVFQGGVTSLPEGLSLVSLADASVEMQSWAAETFTQVKPARHLFGLVNDALATSGVLIDVTDNVNIARPIRIIHRMSTKREAHTRLLVRIGAGAKISIIEDFSGAENSFNTGFAEYVLNDTAELEHYRFALQTADALSVGGCHFNLGFKARLNSTLVGFGSKLSRLDVDVNHVGEHAFAKLNAIYLLDGDELFDLHSTIEHAVPNGTTEENVSGIVAGTSRAVFNGRIHIHRDAQKTLAELNNRNLLMSRNAEINTKPELEIYADDVRCAHGATIAEIDKKALYYLQSRGISKAQAQIMLSFGFINELVDQMPNQVLAEWLRPQLRQRFSNMDVN
jgi:Fe-S cluster assembly protein SufD